MFLLNPSFPQTKTTGTTSTTGPVMNSSSATARSVPAVAISETKITETFGRLAMPVSRGLSCCEKCCEQGCLLLKINPTTVMAVMFFFKVVGNSPRCLLMIGVHNVVNNFVNNVVNNVVCCYKPNDVMQLFSNCLWLVVSLFWTTQPAMVPRVQGRWFQRLRPDPPGCKSAWQHRGWNRVMTLGHPNTS